MGHIAGTNNYSTVSVVAYLVCGVLWLCDRRASSRVVLRVDVGVMVWGWAYPEAGDFATGN